jgi:hypothetical protein
MNRSKTRRAQAKEFKNTEKIRNYLGSRSPSGSIRIQGYRTGRVNTNVRYLNTVSIAPGSRLGLKKYFCTIISVANKWIGVNRTTKTILVISLFQSNYISATPLQSALRTARYVLYSNTI